MRPSASWPRWRSGTTSRTRRTLPTPRKHPQRASRGGGDPSFSVVVATYDRGPLVEATLASVAQQSLADIEVLVASDGPAAPGLARTVAQFGERFRLVETERRSGSQCTPNNFAWSIARGRFIAYLGHDDIWLPGHLAALRDAFEQRPHSDFAASGCLLLGPPGAGSGSAWVTGLFDPDDRWMPLAHFFPRPPSLIAAPFRRTCAGPPRTRHGGRWTRSSCSPRHSAVARSPRRGRSRF